MSPRSVYRSLAGITACLTLGYFAFVKGTRVPLLGGVDLGFHELGHLLTYVFPDVITASMGSITQIKSFIVDADKTNEFEYTDPVDGSVSRAQGLRFVFADGSRCVFRLSGTGSSGATLRVYVERYVGPEAGAEALAADPAVALAPLVGVALGLGDVAKLTGRAKPTVIT